MFSWNWKEAHILLIPWIFYLIHSSLYWAWIVDDAGISYAYARNLSEGHGLVSQPGRIPLEAFSNFTWVCLLALSHSLQVFHPYVTAKIVSAIFILGSFLCVHQVIKKWISQLPFFTMLLLVLYAFNSPLVRWSNSGLENALYIFQLSLFLWASLHLVSQEKPWGYHFFLGVFAATIPLTRPEGILFLCIYPLAQMFRPNTRISWTAYFAGTGLILLMYLAFRLMYFGEWLPVPFYAKGLEHFQGIMSFKKIHILFRGILGPIGFVGFIFFLGSLIFLQIKQKITLQESILYGFFWLAVLAFLLLPYDHLDVYRYASPFFLFAYLAGGLILLKVKPFWGKYELLLFKGTTIGLLCGSLLMGGYLSWKYKNAPIVPFSHIAELGGHRFNYFAHLLNLTDGSLLLPDAGGTLYYSNLEIHDFLGLTNKTLAHNFPQNLKGVHQYIFSELKPSFIEVHGFWAVEADLYAWPGFSKAYVPLYEEWVSLPGLNTDSIQGGIYVRRELIQDRPRLLSILKENAQEKGLP